MSYSEQMGFVFLCAIDAYVHTESILLVLKCKHVLEEQPVTLTVKVSNSRGKL